ncbi:hypothetical protein [Streptomyces uncialis]|uniref:hypothetical protein n=1 Tax=Streptomyces uncialis TaxID=1048205 RepID=UPI0033FE5A51
MLLVRGARRNSRARKFDRSKVEAGVHVEVDLAVRAHLRPEQRGQAAPVGRREKLGPLGFAEDVLEHAIYPEDVISHHRAFIARRRTERPSEEYRELTATEWDEFLAHFELRKVALGTCGRDYATPCQHETPR